MLQEEAAPAVQVEGNASGLEFVRVELQLGAVADQDADVAVARGPGATNLVTPAAYAQLGAMPMGMITGQKPIKTSKQGQFQIVEVVDMMRPLTKLTRQIKTGNSIPAAIGTGSPSVPRRGTLIGSR